METTNNRAKLQILNVSPQHSLTTPTVDNMPRGLPTLLSNEAYTTLLRHDPHNWRIRKHIAAINAIELFRRQFDPSAELKPSHSSVPLRLVILCDHYNRNFLIKPTDSKISSILIWRLFYRHMNVNKSDFTTTSHKAIYIQQRHPTFEEVSPSQFLRRKPTCQQQIGEDYHTIKNNTTILHPINESLMYIAENLHHRMHGSVAAKEVISHGMLFDALLISNEIISPPTLNHHPSLFTKNGITVAYTNNDHIQKLDNILVCGLNRLHHDLTTHLVNGSLCDVTRNNGKVVKSLPSQTSRLRFGFGRVQKQASNKVNWKVHPWQYNGSDMPTIKYQPFTQLPISLKKQLVCVFESAHIFAESHYNQPFCNELRTEIFSKRMNRMLGYPNAKFHFEYIDIVLSLNTKLLKHIDGKNDHREGYNLCVVYSYYHIINKLEYKVSIIMCTRNDVGVAFDRMLGEVECTK